jgi:hypothetical protein
VSGNVMTTSVTLQQNAREVHVRMALLAGALVSYGCVLLAAYEGMKG